MSEPRTHEATTAHGTIQYEAVECAHCGNKVLEEEAIGIMIDPYEVTCKYRGICEGIHRKATKEVVVCRYCAESLFDYRRKAFRDFVSYVKTREFIHYAAAMFIFLLGYTGGTFL